MRTLSATAQRVLLPSNGIRQLASFSPPQLLMPSMRGIFQVVAVAVTLALSPSQAALECRQPNYVTRDGKIFSQDPATPGLENEITIRGVTWSGMEKDNMIPDGLWGSTNPSAASVYGTKVSTLLEFLKNNSINSVRLPLNADFLIKNSFPQLAYIHGYENRELTIWADPNSVTYFDLLGRMIQVLQTEKISVLLDINLLTNYPQDAFWYTAPYVNITESPTYQAVSYLAKAFCNSTYWNVLGIDLKDEMSDVLWNADPKEADVTNDWHGAAEILANRVLELCPSWLVFVGGASSPTDAQRFSVGKDYETLSSHWDGGNLHNATKNPLKINTGNKIVFAPHAHSHGKLPQNYFYSANSNCTRNSPTDYYGLENSEIDSECVDFIEGKKVKSKYSCTSTEFGCSSYEHLTAEAIAKNYQKVMDEAIGDVVKEGKIPVIFGSFSGVYGAQTQPHQTAALDFLINYAATNLRGGYFWALNPDTEYFLEDSTNPKKGLFGKTHYGIFTARSWQVANEDLLTALAKIPSSPIQCYGEKSKGKSDASPLRADVTVALGSAVVTMLYAMW